MSETFTFERGKIDHILSDLASLMLYFKDLRDKNMIGEDVLERIVTIYEHLHMALLSTADRIMTNWVNSKEIRS